VFRVVREALTNVRKHASAHRVTIELATESGRLGVRVIDDGTGIAAKRTGAADWPHYGMQMMRERAAAIGAELTWSNAPGGGTLFDLRVPLTSTAAVPA
jgi:signal transduction histidine kinase